MPSETHIIDARLTDKQPTALPTEFNGMPPEELGRGLGSHRQSIYQHTYDARQRLKPALAAGGYTTCHESLHDLAERPLRRNSIPEDLPAISHHFSLCAECQDDYQLFLTAKRDEG